MPAWAIYDPYVKELMNSQSRNLAILNAIAMLPTLACNCINLFLKPTPSLLPIAEMETRLLHFKNEFIAFDYPAGMVDFNAADSIGTCQHQMSVDGVIIRNIQQVVTRVICHRRVRADTGAGIFVHPADGPR